MWKFIIRNTAGFDMSYDEFEDLHRETWKNEGYKNL